MAVCFCIYLAYFPQKLNFNMLHDLWRVINPRDSIISLILYISLNQLASSCIWHISDLVNPRTGLLRCGQYGTRGYISSAFRKYFFLPIFCQYRQVRPQILMPDSTVTFPRHNGKYNICSFNKEIKLFEGLLFCHIIESCSSF